MARAKLTNRFWDGETMHANREIIDHPNPPRSATMIDGTREAFSTEDALRAKIRALEEEISGQKQLDLSVPETLAEATPEASDVLPETVTEKKALSEVAKPKPAAKK